MLTFYPEFEACPSKDFEVVDMVDVSNSMKGTPLQEAKKVALLALHHLPNKCYFNVVAFGTGRDVNNQFGLYEKITPFPFALYICQLHAC